ncbi:IS5/IS1182 family transposase (plasmid) [Azospirillum brasilense]|uniref:IS5/IS1182 family transposase n=1 Tax=Azospirillum brasilense TaxID=192 RepID=A0A0P0EU00_AZOBR|nr:MULTISPECIES: IS5/IS1182 family transposase [Azospirillum]ALJ39511.1 hypothetical protein AMK58_28840 [Azospirillum brasilense]MDW7555748.1 IS5/IS1182 family transposase [Azospirillum brasilense]MDW7595816.1 IS5/IS1182 family transposase [Azospirillum brasilense]MDW7630821.1 IS5/IS1182 family transposase [Azospirillum brasilense]MDX5955730.1 IS5/IS1182 family transposase [Azospirillum brasilense]
MNLYQRVREQEGREASPTAALLGNQSARAAERETCGGPGRLRPGRKIKGVKHHILVGTLGLLLNVVVHHAGPQDHDGGDRRLEIVKRSDQAKSFVVLPKRWLAEQTLSRLTRCRRLVRHYEQYLCTSVVVFHIAMIRLRLCQLAQKQSFRSST